MTKPKPNRQSKPLTVLLKSVRKGNILPERGPQKSVYYAALEAAQVTDLKKLARQNRTTLAQELTNAIDAYCLGLSRGAIRLINTFLDSLNESLDRNSRALDEALRETKTTRVDVARKKRRGRSTVSRRR